MRFVFTALLIMTSNLCIADNSCQNVNTEIANNNIIIERTILNQSRLTKLIEDHNLNIRRQFDEDYLKNLLLKLTDYSTVDRQSVIDLFSALEAKSDKVIPFPSSLYDRLNALNEVSELIIEAQKISVLINNLADLNLQSDVHFYDLAMVILAKNSPSLDARKIEHYLKSAFYLGYENSSLFELLNSRLKVRTLLNKLIAGCK